jgi:hypothetical protein
MRVIGWVGPLAIVGSFLVCAVALFTVNTVYSDVQFDGIREVKQLAAGRVAMFYLWHFVQLVPMGDIPETLRWEPPLTYSGSDVGIRVTLFQVTTVATTFATLRAYWEYWKQQSEPDSRGADA